MFISKLFKTKFGIIWFLKIIKKYGLVVSHIKIKLFQIKIHFHSYYIFEGHIRPINRTIQFVDKFNDVITNKIQLQRFFNSLNYVHEIYKDYTKHYRTLFESLRPNPPFWSNTRTFALSWYSNCQYFKNFQN